MKKEKFSFSKLSSFHTCEYSYYLNYVFEGRREISKRDSVYGYLGGVVHELIEKMTKNEINKETALKTWQTEFEYTELMDMNFPTDNAKKKYYTSIQHYLENYTPLTSIENMISEEYFIYEINGIPVRGFIDAIVFNEEEKTVRVVDYKTSSKFSKKDLTSSKVFQLILYTMYIEEKYPEYKVLPPAFDMLKYAKSKKNGRVFLRNDIMFFDSSEYERYLLEVPYDEEQKKNLIEYVTSTVISIDKNDKTDGSDWTPTRDNEFYCSNLCSFYDVCKYCKNNG